MPDARLGWGSHQPGELPNRCLQYPVHSTKCKQGYIKDWGGAVTSPVNSRIVVFNILCTVQNASKVILKSDDNANSYYHLRSTSIEFTNVS
ncbi:hypothetical protein QE152_g18160 [Popillia japonica]|uniref:Uncharacterized protein n=1 Tax=Popillia japonica TaxID=7064 RepID=A0AAW1L4H2_POPJA